MCIHMKRKQQLNYLKAKQEQRDISMKELQTSLTNTMQDIKRLVAVPNWEELYKEKLLGIFLDTRDKMFEDSLIFKKEYEDVFD